MAQLKSGSTVGGKAIIVTDDSRLSDARTPISHDHPLKADKTYVDTQDELKADITYVDGKVKTDVPVGAKFTDTITTINGKTGTITKTDITALGIPAQDTVVDISGKADTTYVDSQDALKADKTEVTSLANKVPSTKELVTVVDKNQHYPIIMDNSDETLGRHLTQVWGGSAFVEDESLGVGANALINNSGSNSNGFGHEALASNTKPYSNGFGNGSLQTNKGENSNGFGHQSLQNNIGRDSNGFGAYSLQGNTGTFSNGFGAYSLQNNTVTASSGFGYQSLQNNTGANSSGFGNWSLRNNTGRFSSGFGGGSLGNNTGENSNGFGNNSLYENTGANSNGVGHWSLRNNKGANSNGFGAYSLHDNTGAYNTAVGHNSNSEFIDNILGNKTCDASDIDVSTERITITAHGFGEDGTTTLVRYSSTTGTPIGYITVGEIYPVKIVDANTIQFDNKIYTQGTGTHTFTPSANYSNTTCLGANTLPNKSNQVVLGDDSVDTVKMGGTFRTPASGTAEGVKGETCWDADYFYICVETDTWKRTPLRDSQSERILENYTEKLVTLSGTSTTIDLSLANVFAHSLTGNTTYSITNAVSGQAHSFTLVINQTATVGTLTFPASVKWQGGEIPDMTTANKTYLLTFMTVDGGTVWLGMFGGEF